MLPWALPRILSSSAVSELAAGDADAPVMLARIVLSAIGATLPRASDPAPSCAPLRLVRPDPLPVVVSKAPDDGIETLQACATTEQLSGRGLEIEPP